MRVLWVVLAGTIRRLRRVPRYVVRAWRWLVLAVAGPPATANPHYAVLRAKAVRGEALTLDDVNRVVVPLLVSRGREIERLRIEALVPYGVIVVMLATGAFFAQRFLEGTREAARVNCTLIRNLVVMSGADGSPTLAGELQQTYRAELEAGMDARRLRRVRALQTEIQRAGVQLQAPDCDRVVESPESVRSVTIPQAAPAVEREP